MSKSTSTLSLVIALCAIVLTGHLVERIETSLELKKLKIERETLSIELLKLQLDEKKHEKSATPNKVINSESPQETS